VTFGLVHVPVKLYSAVESKTVHFHEVHEKDGARIEHRRFPRRGLHLCGRHQPVFYEKSYYLGAGGAPALHAAQQGVPGRDPRSRATAHAGSKATTAEWPDGRLRYTVTPDRAVPGRAQPDR
jgi:hypothetical protein